MPGIEDLMNIRTQGGTENAPMGMGMPPGMPPQGGAPMPPPSPPPMAGGMPPDMGGVSPDMLMAEQMPMEEEEQGSIEKDSIQLAGAVMERAGKDPQTAVAILEGAAGLIMQSTQQDPMMMEQDPMMANMGGAMYPQQMNMGGGIYPQYAKGGKYMKPKYAAEGDYLSEESDTLRQMLMDGLDMFDVTRGQGMIINEGDLMGMGRTMSDADKDLRLDMGLDAEYYNMLEDERNLEKLIEQRRK